MAAVLGYWLDYIFSLSSTVNGQKNNLKKSIECIVSNLIDIKAKVPGDPLQYDLHMH